MKNFNELFSKIFRKTDPPESTPEEAVAKPQAIVFLLESALQAMANEPKLKNKDAHVTVGSLPPYSGETEKSTMIRLQWKEKDRTLSFTVICSPLHLNKDFKNTVRVAFVSGARAEDIPLFLSKPVQSLARRTYSVDVWDLNSLPTKILTKLKTELTRHEENPLKYQEFPRMAAVQSPSPERKATLETLNADPSPSAVTSETASASAASISQTAEV